LEEVEETEQVPAGAGRPAKRGAPPASWPHRLQIDERQQQPTVAVHFREKVRRMQIAMHQAGTMQPSAKMSEGSSQFAAKRGSSESGISRIARELVERHDVRDLAAYEITIAGERASRCEADGHAIDGRDSSRPDLLGSSGFSLCLSAANCVSDRVPPMGRFEVFDKDSAGRQIESYDRSMGARFNRGDSLQGGALGGS
jgi:hypothetical protein